MFYLNLISHEPYASSPFAFAVIAIRFVPPTANFIYPLEESRIFYDTSEGVAANRSQTHSAENHAYELPRKNRTTAQSRRGNSIRRNRQFESLPHFSQGIRSSLRTHDSRFLQVEEKSERAFLLIKEALVALMFFNEKSQKAGKDTK